MKLNFFLFIAWLLTSLSSVAQNPWQEFTYEMSSTFHARQVEITALNLHTKSLDFPYLYEKRFYDSYGKLEQSVYYGPGDLVTKKQMYDYDPYGNVTKVTSVSYLGADRSPDTLKRTIKNYYAGKFLVRRDINSNFPGENRRITEKFEYQYNRMSTKTVLLPNNKVFSVESYQYDKKGRLNYVKLEERGKYPQERRYKYHEDGTIAEIKQYQNFGLIQVSSFNYPREGQCIKVDTGADGMVLQKFHYKRSA